MSMQISKIIRELRVFEENYVPDILYVRKDIADMLIAKYMRRIAHGASGSDITLIYGLLGRVGIGKTTIARYVARNVEMLARRQGHNVRHVYVNVYDLPTIHETLNRILLQVNPKVAQRGTSISDKLKALVDTLYMSEMRLLIVLDEIQMFFKKPGMDIEKLYTLFRIHEIIPGHSEPGVGVDYILVAQSDEILSYLRDKLPQVESQIGLRLTLQPYTTEELYHILSQRAEAGLYPGTWDDTILETISEYYGVDSRVAKRPIGSARSAIVALRTAAEIAEAQGAYRISEDHVSRALGLDTPATVDRSILQALSKHELLLLLAIADLTEEKQGYATTGEVRTRYEDYTRMYGERPRGHTQFNEYIRRLSALDLVIAKASSKGVRGRTTLMRLSPEIPSSILRSEIIMMLEGRIRA
jgi:cell division control protein 6